MGDKRNQVAHDVDACTAPDISGGLMDGETVVLAGVHTVYAGERVSPVRPLFDGEGDVAGPAPAGNTGRTVSTAGVAQ